MTSEDTQHMARALELAQRGKYTTSPNPCVGCVIVKDGVVVGEGYHRFAGGPHAEVYALEQAGDKARGATCYVTLEPCSHQGRTPPCAEALVKAGVGKVIAAMEDPNPLVCGRGMTRLAQAGIEVHAGLLQQQAEELNRGFVKRMKGQGPFVQCKMASTLDGKTALANGKSQWITSPQARADVQKFRAQSCAIISGADTVIADNARLNVRWQADPDMPQRQPVRVIIDTQNRLKPDLTLFEQQSAVIIVRQSLDNTRQWPHFVEQVVVPMNSGKADLSAVLALLAERGMNRLWIEAGATLAGAFVDAGLVDELVLYQAPKLIGDDGRGLLKTRAIEAMDKVPELDIVDLRMVGPDIRIIARQK